MGSYFSPKAKIAFSSMKSGQSINLEEYKKYLSDRYLNDDGEIVFLQIYASSNHF